jgi:acyl carrier protein
MSQLSAGLRDMIATLLRDAGDTAPFAPGDSLFLSGRLDSLAAVEVLAALEQEHGLDLSDADFDITEIDTLAQIEALARAREPG